MGLVAACCCYTFSSSTAALLMEYWVHRDNEIQMLEARTSPGMTAKIVLPDSL